MKYALKIMDAMNVKLQTSLASQHAQQHLLCKVIKFKTVGLWFVSDLFDNDKLI